MALLQFGTNPRSSPICPLDGCGAAPPILVVCIWPISTGEFEALPSEETSLYRPRAGAEHRDACNQDSQRNMKPLVALAMPK
jgi:hypothetical protein